MAHRLGRLGAAILLVLLVGCDHGSKRWAHEHLVDDDRPVISGWLQLDYAENRDVAFNALRWIDHDTRQRLLTALGPLTVLALFAFGWRAWKTFTPLQRLASVAIGAGAIGNVLDRLTRGHVIDRLIGILRFDVDHRSKRDHLDPELLFVLGEELRGAGAPSATFPPPEGRPGR